ncbi:signal peptidase I [Geodermatophilus sp. YIM 151500]|uniref:signal peptidase I n=1 Tax=Geodermatophilus sp. YIM 151500 TaxID=2984531 RepID=UPI0021E3E598|nr:signal peptidase I [Geodermatophilus sp. YIM 151500]MCV2488961.1 signal peptidase I [Geodermatophilus sp. YIM 151500]
MSSDRPGGPADTVPGGADGGDPGRPDDAGRSGGSRARHRERDPKRGSLLRELPVLLLVAFVLAVLVKTFLVQAFFIPSGSMEQTLHGCPGCTGDRVLVNKVPYWFDEPQPGDIVVFTGPDTWTPEVRVSEPTNWVTGALLWLGRTVGVAPPSEDDFIKRVIAVGGQTVQCCDAEGRVTVDGKPLHEPYIYENKPLEGRTFPPVTVPEGRLWVMGDHRSASADSTVHIGDQYAGTISVDDVIGKAAVIVWPPSRIGLLDSPAIQAAGSAGQGVDAGPASAGVQAVAPAMAATPAVAAAASPGAVGLAAALPVAAWRAARRRTR